MSPLINRQEALVARSRYLRAGWGLLAMAILAIAVPIALTAARPHVLWLFTVSYGAVALVLGVTLIRAGHGCPLQRKLEQLSWRTYAAWHRS
jgi:hypothetical protein